MCHPDMSGTESGGATSRNEQHHSIAVDGATMPLFQARPDGPSRGNVVIIHDIYGANDFYHSFARRLAAAGFTAWLPDLFVRHDPLPEQTSEHARARGALLPYPLAIKDLGAVFDEAQRRSPGKLGTVGFCMGGTLVMLLAARESRMDAGVIYYGFPANANPSENRPWQPIDEAARVQTPLLGFWGDQDRGVGMENVAAYQAALTAAGKAHDFTIYPGLPHGFLTFDETSPNYAGSQDSWAKTLVFFGDHLT